MARSKTKVIMITNYYFPTIGGISTNIESIVSGLNKKGIDTGIKVYPLAFRRFEQRSKSKLWKGLMRRFFLIFFIINAELSILKSRFGTRTLIVHTHSAGFCLFIGILSKAFGCRAVHTYHSPIDKSFKNLEKLSPATDAVIFVSDEARKLYETYIKIDNDEIVIIPGVIDHNQFYPYTGKEIAEIKHELSGTLLKKHERDRIVLFVGRVVEIKGVMVLIKSIKTVKENIPNIFLIISGPYSHGREEKLFFDMLQAYIKKHKLTDNIYFTGEDDRNFLKKLYAVSEFVVCPSIWEASGIVPLEAMASGKPVIATRVGGLEYRIIDGKTGFLVEKNNPGELADKILVLLKNDKLRRKMGRLSREHIEEKYTQEQMVTSYMAVYKLQ